MHIRRAQEQDVPLLAKVHVDSWRAAHRGLVPDSVLQGFTYQRREEKFRRCLVANAEETWVVQENEEVVGFLTVGASRDPDLDVNLTGAIWRIYISPNYWGRGIGRRLVEQAERLLRSRGYGDVVLWVLEGNQGARRFYEASGFKLDGKSKKVNWGVELKAVRYGKHLEHSEET